MAGSTTPEVTTAGGTPQAGTSDPGTRRDDVEVRNRRLARSGVAAAQRILADRYRMSSLQDAFELLRQTSQRCNVKMHTLADAVTHVAGPDTGAARWFPRRARYAPPPLPGLDLNQDGRNSHGAVLRAALRRALHITDTPMGNVQLAENGLLRLEKHTGLSREFTDFFAFVQDSTTACAQAAQDGRPVTVKDVAASDIFDTDSRETILRAGSRAVHSLPLTSRTGTVLGLISSHYENPLTDLARSQLTALDTLGAQTGHWLLWHRHTVVLDALEHLHATGTGAR